MKNIADVLDDVIEAENMNHYDSTWGVRQHILAALAKEGYEIRPAQTYGFIAMNNGKVLTERPFSNEEVARLEHPDALRIVELVAVL